MKERLPEAPYGVIRLFGEIYGWIGVVMNCFGPYDTQEAAQEAVMARLRKVRK